MGKRFKWPRKPTLICCHLAEILVQDVSGKSLQPSLSCSLLLPHVAKFLLQYQLDIELFEQARHMFRMSWPEQRLCGLVSFDANFVLAHDCLTYEVDTGPSTLKRKRLVWNDLLYKILAKMDQWLTAVAQSSLMKRRYCRVKTIVGKNSCLLQSMTFKIGPFAWVKRHNALMAKPLTFFWIQLNSILCTSSTIRTLS